MTTFETYLHHYVQLGVRVGVNIQEGQTLVIQAPTSALTLVRLAAKAAYEAGAKHVHVEWNDDELTRIKFELAPEESFGVGPDLKAKVYDDLLEQRAAFLSFVSSNPDLLSGVDPDRVSAATKAANVAMQRFRQAVRSDKISWSILAVPSEVWAEKVFPDTPSEERMDRLWGAVFQATRADQADPIGAWREHLHTLKSRADVLNAKRYRALHYTAPGTDLTVELADDHLWITGDSTNEQGVMFVANMPTEEVFTAPKRNGVNGVVRSTKPLNYAGSTIHDFSLTFKDGKVVDYTAVSGYETLKRLLEQDEGASFLGEVALVPHHSPISEMDTIFYNTLFDENASNHLAIGSAYSFCIKGGNTMTADELAKHGLNDSLVHVDFMIGSAEMNIDGITSDGRREPVFRNGNWAN